MFDKVQTFDAKKTTFAQIESKMKKIVYCSQVDATRKEFLIEKNVYRKSQRTIFNKRCQIMNRKETT